MVKLACCDEDVEDDDDVSLMLLVLELTTFCRVVVLSLCFCKLSKIVDISGPEEFVTASEISGIYKNQDEKRRNKWERVWNWSKCKF